VFRPDITPEVLNERGGPYLPGLVGVEITQVTAEGLTGRMPVRPDLLAPNGYLHAASVIALADTLTGYGTIANLPDGAKSFTTIELKSNFLGTARDGVIVCTATPAHLGRSTQVWDAVVSDEASGRKIALFRCTQMILQERR
jgi:uncharacterized protein (TIGR00369 family)